MQGVLFVIPHRSIEIVSVFWQSGQVHDSKITASTGPILIVGSGPSKVVVAGPHKLSDGIRLIFHCHKVFFGQIAPRAPFHVVA